MYICMNQDNLSNTTSLEEGVPLVDLMTEGYIHYKANIKVTCISSIIQAEKKFTHDQRR